MSNMQKYLTLISFMDAMIDELHSSCSDADEILDYVDREYDKIGTHAVACPDKHKSKQLAILDSNEEAHINLLFEDIQSYTELIYERMKAYSSEKAADFFVSEAKSLADSYMNSSDENDFVSVHPDVLLARRNRIVSEFDILTSPEIENEYLLMYNAYTSEIRRCTLFDKMLCTSVNKDDVYHTMLTVSANFTEKMEQDGALYLAKWTPQDIYERKESFLNLISEMNSEDAMVCYKEICDVWLSRTQFTEIFKEECVNNFGLDIVNKAYQSMNRQIAKDFVEKDMPDEEIEASLTSEEKDMLSDLFDV